jgi:hypothetical protein
VATAHGGTGGASATVTQYGGIGGTGYDGANGGAGGLSKIYNQVSGGTDGSTLTFNETAVGGAGGGSYGGTAGAAGSATAGLNRVDATSAVVNGTASAFGGHGGYGLSGSTASALGGAASANVTLSVAHSASATANAGAYGYGSGGEAYGSGNAANGGTATAISVIISSTHLSTDTLTAVAVAVAGNGGNSWGVSNAGNGASASVTASVNSPSASGSATASATGGNGGYAYGTGNAGNGGAVTLLNAVSGTAPGNTLSLTQDAIGGSGGLSGSGTAGAGGAASSTLNVTDTGTKAANDLVVALAATGGAGGYSGGPTPGAVGVGGAASIGGTISGLNTVSVTAEAAGGGSGYFSTSGNTPGNASSTLTVSGKAVNVSAGADAGGSILSAGIATTMVTATGTSGGITTHATAEHAYNSTPGLVDHVSASATINLAGTATAQTVAAIANDAAITTSVQQAVALIDGAPDPAVVNLLLASTKQSKIIADFGAKPTFMALGELGGGQATGGTGLITEHSELSFTATFTDITKNLDIGFLSGNAQGTGVTSVTLDVYVNGSDLLSKTFTSAAAAKTYFSNNAFDLGAFSNPVIGTQFGVTIDMSVTMSSGGSGFWGGVLVGAGTHFQNS